MNLAPTRDALRQVTHSGGLSSRYRKGPCKPFDIRCGPETHLPAFLGDQDFGTFVLEAEPALVQLYRDVGF